MSKLSPAEREALYREKGERDGLDGQSKPPGMSTGEKIGLTVVTVGLGAASFIPDQSDRDRKAYLEGNERGQEARKILDR